MGWPSTMLPLLQSSPSPLGDDIDAMSADSSSWLGSLMCFGGILSSPFYNYMVNRHSRKLTGYLVGLPGVIGWLLVLTAQSELMLFAGRLFLEVNEGFGNQINLCPDRGLNPGPPAQKSDTLPLDHQVTMSGDRIFLEEWG
uniref:Uncharacterized protein n=1 Tax=Timema bartmani TaxID=61472 RepID=A0A7R9ES98_9NEOP|nr:unnamed protein product [Timema bartmani]